MRLQTLCIIIITILVGRLVYFLEPFGICVDESTFMAVAESWRHYGELYVDAVDRKGPLTFGAYALIQSLFGDWNIHAVHISFLFIVFALCLLAEAINRRLPEGLPSGAAAIVCALMASSFPRGFIAGKSEWLFLLPLGFAFLILFQGLSSQRAILMRFSLASVLAATATLFQPASFLPFAAGIIAVWILWLQKKQWLWILQSFGAILLGVSFVYALTFIVFSAAGTLNEMLRWVLFDNLSYLSDSEAIDELSRPLFLPFLVAFISWPMLWIAWSQKAHLWFRDEREVLLFGAIIGSFLYIIAGGRFYAHYFIPLAWFLSIAAASAIEQLYWSKYKKLVVLGLVSPFVVFFIITTFRDDVIPWFTGSTDVHSFDRKAQSSYLALSEFIQKQTEPKDRIVVWGMLSQIYVASERGSGSRFVHADYVSGRFAGFSTPKRQPSQKALRLYLQDMEEKQPLLFIDTHPASMNDYEFFPLADYSELYQYLEDHYEFTGYFEDFGIWRRQ